MITDEDLGQWLRRELHEHESARPPVPGLAEDVVVGARRATHRRAGLVAGGAALVAAAVVAGVVLVAAGPGRSGGDGLSPLHSPSVSPSDAADTPAVLLAGAWAASLPEGDPPEVPYASQTELHLPDGQVVDLGGTGSEVIGDTVAGTVLLVENEQGDGGHYEFDSWYVVVSDDGRVARLDTGSNLGDHVQDAAVSPDGRWFTDGRIFDMSTGEVAGALPEGAEYLIAWTPAGILYGTRGDGEAYLWNPGDQDPVKLARWPAQFPNGTDVGFDRRDGCPVVVRLTDLGDEEELSRQCGEPALTVSPAGSWFLTGHLEAINTVTGERHLLADRAIRNLGYFFDAHWLDEDTVLLSVPGGGYVNGTEAAPSESAVVVRCDLAADTCERATGPVTGVGNNQLVGLP